MSTLPERFWNKVNKTDTCWLWTAAVNKPDPNGYGMFWNGERLVTAHRLAYIDAVGSIPDGADLDHLCRVRRCVRPDHLEPVSRSENLIRGINKNREKSTCPRGHVYDTVNATTGGRACKTCRAEASRRHYLRTRYQRSTT